MPFGYRFLFWVVIFDVGVLTGMVWLMAIRAAISSMTDIVFPSSSFFTSLLVYHVILLLLALLFLFIAKMWHSERTLAMFPVVVILLILSLHLFALRLAYILLWFA